MSGSVAKNLIEARLGGKVERCHNIPHHGSYSNAAHQWGVAMLLFFLFPEHFARLVIYALTHDVPEGWVGDLPSPVKPHLGDAYLKIKALEDRFQKRIGLPPMGDLSEEDELILKICDTLEFYLWACEQVAMGNRFVKSARDWTEEYLEKLEMPAVARQAFEELREMDVVPGQQGAAFRETLAQADKL